MKINSNSIRKLIKAHIVLLVIFLFLWSTLDLPWNLVYFFDILVCLEFAWALRGVRTVMRKSGMRYMIPYLVIFAFYLFLTQIVNIVSPGLSILAYRKIFRFYLFYFACATLLTVSDIDKVLNLFLKIQWVNLLATVYQFFVLDLRADNIGGIFGTGNGVNAYTNIFLCIISTYMIVKYIDKKEKLMPVVLTLGISLVVSAMAELKIFFIEIIVIVLLAILLFKPSARTIKIIFFGIVGLIAGLVLLGYMFPEHLQILLSIALLTEYATGSLSGYHIGRLDAFSKINNLFFDDKILRNLFGFGFGNCEEGSVFYEWYGKYNYTWFSHQVTFLETGYVGVLLYLFFFLLVFLHANKSKKLNPENKYYYNFAQIICVLCVIWFVYNQSLRIESGYLVFFALAIPVVLRNDLRKKSANSL